MTGRRQGRPVMTWFVRVLAGRRRGSGLVPPADRPSSRRPTPRSISTYDAAMDLSREGDLRTVETIGVQMPGGKHGIFRIFDTADPRRDNVSHPVDGRAPSNATASPSPTRTVTARTAPTPSASATRSVYLDPGAHTYRIVSSTTDVFEPGASRRDPLVVGRRRLRLADADRRSRRWSSTLPAEPLRAECVRGDDEPCTASVEGTSLPGRHRPAGALHPGDGAGRVRRGRRRRADPGCGRTAACSGALVAGAARAGAWRRCCGGGPGSASPGFPVLFEPPFMVPPALGVRVLDEKDSEADLQATLFDLAERGVLHLRGGDESWYVELVQPLEGEQLHPLEAGLLSSLGLAPGRRHLRRGVHRELGSRGRHGPFDRCVRRSSGSSGQYLRSSPAPASPRSCSAGSRWPPRCSWSGATSSTTAGCGGRCWSAPPRSPSRSPAPCSARGSTTVRTAEGRDLWSRTGGFARFLTTDSSESRFDAAAHMDWYPRYLAWAVALGCRRRVGASLRGTGGRGARRAVDRLDGHRAPASARGR